MDMAIFVGITRGALIAPYIGSTSFGQPVTLTIAEIMSEGLCI